MTIDVEAFVEFEAAGFSSKAAAYHRHFGDVTGQFAAPLLDAAGVRQGSRVLDVASGPGQVAARAAARGASVVGVDVSAGMVELARRLHPDVEYRVGDAHRLPDPDRSYDAVVANLVMPHLADHARAWHPTTSRCASWRWTCWSAAATPQRRASSSGAPNRRSAASGSTRPALPRLPAGVRPRARGPSCPDVPER